MQTTAEITQTYDLLTNLLLNYAESKTNISIANVDKFAFHINTMKIEIRQTNSYL